MGKYLSMNSKENLKDAVKISVAVITYNHERFIGRAIDSILMQKVDANLEIVVGEDCSTDKTRDILMNYYYKYPLKFKLLIREKNIGPVANWLDVLLSCEGKYIAILEGDDYWINKTKLQKQIDILENDENIAGVYHAVKVIDENGRDVNTVPQNGRDFDTINDFINSKYFIPTPSIMFRNFYLKSNINEIKKLYSNLNWVGDYQNDLVICSYGKYRYLNKIMAVYRNNLTGGNTFSSLNLKERLKEGIQARKNGDAYFKFKYHQLFKLSIREFKIEPFIPLIKSRKYFSALYHFTYLNLYEKNLLIKYLYKIYYKKLLQKTIHYVEKMF